MSLPRYPEYKDSGVEWLGETPADWRIVRYKEIFFERDERSVEGSETLLSVSAYTGVSPRSEIIGDGDHLSRAESLEGYKVCYPDDLVMNIMLAWNRGLGFSAFHGIVSPAYCVFKPHSDLSPRFFDYLIRDDRTNLYFKAFSSGVIDSRLRLYPDVFGSLYCGLPSQEEQTAIAAFLDRETAKIDGLIAEQEKLIALLAEKRQATISHAVTKGLNPAAPMKDSGVAWLGEVPAHWEIPYLNRLIESADLGGNYDASEGESGIALIKMGNLGRGVIKIDKVENLPEVADFDPIFLLKEGDFLFNTRNSLDLVGKVAIWRNELPYAIYNSNILRVRFKSDAVSTNKFINYFFNSALGLSQLRLIAKGTTSVAAIYYKDLASMRILLPPIAEQGLIATHLDVICQKLVALTAEATDGITLLKERRSALISAAVTGKIDVRHLAELKAA